MAIPVEMPKMSDTMEEGVLVSWQAEEGDELSAGDIIAQVETDKATMDLEVYDDGVLLKRVIGEGDSVPIGGLIAVLGEKGEDPGEILAQYQGGGEGKEEERGGTQSGPPDEAKQSKGEGEGEGEEDAEELASQEDMGEGQDVRAGKATPPREVKQGTPPKEAAQGAAKHQDAGSGTQRTAAPVARKGAGQQAAAAERAPSGDGAQNPATVARGDGRTKSSPLARRMAEEHGINLAQLQGSGPEGRIIKRDVQTAIEEGVAEPAAVPGQAREAQVYEFEAVEVEAREHAESQGISQMRKTIARRLAESKFTAPHFYLTVDVDMDNAAASRQEINRVAEAQNRPKVSFNDLITKACAMALRRHPDVNASYLEKEGEIRRYSHVHVAVAVAIDEGLVTPVIRHADRKGLSQIAAETRDLAGRARERKLQPADWEGSTFTTSNLGMYGIEEFTAIINPPNSCILAIGAVRDVPVVKNDAVVPGKRMKLTLSCDHRLVDGATGAEFLSTVQQYLEEPLSMLL